jgi:hypothetical protein
VGIEESWQWNSGWKQQREQNCPGILSWRLKSWLTIKYLDYFDDSRTFACFEIRYWITWCYFYPFRWQQCTKLPTGIKLPAHHQIWHPKDLAVTQNRNVNRTWRKYKLPIILYEELKYPWIPPSYTVNTATIPLFRFLTHDHISLPDQWKRSSFRPNHFIFACWCSQIRHSAFAFASASASASDSTFDISHRHDIGSQFEPSLSLDQILYRKLSISITSQCGGFLTSYAAKRNEKWEIFRLTVLSCSKVILCTIVGIHTSASSGVSPIWEGSLIRWQLSPKESSKLFPQSVR